jgi:hypothetical protein
LKTGTWRDSAELIGIAAIVASLIFVGLQLRQEQRIAVVELNQNSTAINTEYQIAIASIADTWVKANNGEVLSESETLAIERIVMAGYRMAATDTFERRRLGNAGLVSTRFFALWLFQNPGVRRIWQMQMQEDLNQFSQIAPDTSIFVVYDEVLAFLEELDSQNGR